MDSIVTVRLVRIKRCFTMLSDELKLKLANGYSKEVCKFSKVTETIGGISNAI